MKFILNKNYIVWSILIMISTSVYGQKIESMDAKSLKINYDKTLHLIFPNDIKYFNIGNENVAGDNPEEVKNILRLKANVRAFEGETNVSVVTSDGKYYLYLVAYSDTLPYTYMDLKDDYKKPAKIPVSDDKFVHLIFPGKVKYIDFGDNTISVFKADGVDNIIKVKAEQIDFPETNVSIVTEDNHFYTFNVCYRYELGTLSYVVDNKGDNKQVAMLDENELNNVKKEEIHLAINNNQNSMRLRDINNKIIFCVQNIFIRRNIIFLKMELVNRSTIDYDIDFIKFYIQDRKISKKTAMQQLMIEPLFFYDYSKQVQAKKRHTFTVAFEKFTIPDKKNLVIELQEANGGRHFQFKITNRQILSAEILK